MRFLKTPLFYIFLAAVFTRLGLGLTLDSYIQFEGDFSVYESAALSFLNGGMLGPENYGPIAPGAAVFIAAAYALFGKSAFALVILQSILGGLLVLGAYFLSLYVFGSRQAAHAAAIFAAFLPNFLIQIIVPGDTFVLYAALFLFGFLFFLRAAFGGSYTFSALAAVFFAAAALTEPIVFYIPLIFVLWFAIIYFVEKFTATPIIRTHQNDPKENKNSGHSGGILVVRVAIIFLLVFGSLISLWTARNHFVFSGKANVPLIAKQEQKFLNPNRLQTFARPFVKLDVKLLAGKFEEMLFSPHKLWLINPYLHYPSHKALAKNILTGKISLADVSGQDFVLLGVKSAATAIHWLIMVLGVWALWIFRKRGIWILVFLAFAYISFVTIGFNAWKPQEGLAPLSGHFMPVFALLSVFASYPVYLICEKLRRRVGY